VTYVGIQVIVSNFTQKRILLSAHLVKNFAIFVGKIQTEPEITRLTIIYVHIAVKREPILQKITYITALQIPRLTGAAHAGRWATPLENT
jgi:hypothetical protein